MQAVLRDDFKQQSTSWFYCLNKVRMVVSYSTHSRDTSWINEWGHPLREVWYYKDRKSSEYTYSYDEFGMVAVSQGIYYDDSNRVSAIFTHHYSYEVGKNGLSEKCVEIEDTRVEFTKGVVKDTTYGIDLFEYNATGQKIKRTTTEMRRWCGVGDYEPVTASATYSYDKDGHLLKEHEVSKGGCDGKNERIMTCRYDAHGLLVEVVKKNDGITVDSTYSERDAQGNAVRYYSYRRLGDWVYEGTYSYITRGLKSKIVSSSDGERDTEYFEYAYYP